MNNKLTRIFSQLQRSKDKGVLEIDLLKDWETPGNTRLIKHRLNKMLGGNAIVVKNGIWYLSEYYWSMTKNEFKESVNQMNLIYLIQKNSLVVLGVVCVLSILVVAAFTIGYILGVPNNIETCNTISYETFW